MSPKVEDEWSDSDDEVLSEVETSVLLGVPDGPVDSTTDSSDAAVSRIGGHPVRYIFLHMYCLSTTCSLTTCLPIQGVSPI
jgi:pre-rRNA-processing protein TSR4